MITIDRLDFPSPSQALAALSRLEQKARSANRGKRGASEKSVMLNSQGLRKAKSASMDDESQSLLGMTGEPMVSRRNNAPFYLFENPLILINSPLKSIKNEKIVAQA
jgi:hypothetical protein